MQIRIGEIWGEFRLIWTQLGEKRKSRSVVGSLPTENGARVFERIQGKAEGNQGARQLTRRLPT